MWIHDNLELITINLRFGIVGSFWVPIGELGCQYSLWYCILVLKFVGLWGLLITFWIEAKVVRVKGVLQSGWRRIGRLDVEEKRHLGLQTYPKTKANLEINWHLLVHQKIVIIDRYEAQWDIFQLPLGSPNFGFCTQSYCRFTEPAQNKPQLCTILLKLNFDIVL